MIKLLLPIILTLLISFSVEAAPQFDGSQFEKVWDQVESDSYELPHNEISFGSLFSWGVDLIKRAAKRTLNDRSDILPQFKKLAHPNGICLKGVWNIDQENIYSGYFKKGSTGLLIARASTAMSNTTRGSYRAFGFAGKLFPTSNEQDEAKLKTANFFLVDDLGGTMANHYTSVEMTNEPELTKTSDVISHILYALKLQRTFGNADRNPGVRQVYEISELGESDKTKAVTPRWMKVQAATEQRIDEDDFRNELNVDHYNGVLVFNISVASSQNKDGVKNWKTIGTIRFDSSVVSNSCDHRLHFPHPKWKADSN